MIVWFLVCSDNHNKGVALAFKKWCSHLNLVSKSHEYSLFAECNEIIELYELSEFLRAWNLMNKNLTLYNLIQMRCTNTSPFISSNFMQLLIKKSRFDQQASSFIKSPLKNMQIQNVKFSKYLSTPIILDAVVYEKTNFSVFWAWANKKKKSR